MTRIKRGGYEKAKGRSSKDARHVRLHYWLLDSAAYQALKPVSRSLLVEFYKRFNGVNNGEFYFSVRDAASSAGVSPNTAQKAIRELIEKGFIKQNVKGSFHWKGGDATTWILTEHEYRDKLPTKDFMRWKLDDEKQKPASDSETAGVSSCDRDNNVVVLRRAGGVSS